MLDLLVFFVFASIFFSVTSQQDFYAWHFTSHLRIDNISRSGALIVTFDLCDVHVILELFASSSDVMIYIRFKSGIRAGSSAGVNATPDLDLV